MRPLLLLIVAVILTSSSTGSDTSPWVHSGDAPIPPGVIRVTTLGSGSPDVRKEQVSTWAVLYMYTCQWMTVTSLRAPWCLFAHTLSPIERCIVPLCPETTSAATVGSRALSAAAPVVPSTKPTLGGGGGGVIQATRQRLEIAPYAQQQTRLCSPSHDPHCHVHSCCQICSRDSMYIHQATRSSLWSGGCDPLASS